MKLLNSIVILFTSSAAFAEESARVPAGMDLALMGFMFFMIYFLMIRPQNKKAKEHKEMVSSISVGDEVLTQGGLLGKIVKDAGSFFLISFSNGSEVVVQKSAVSQVLPKGTLKSI